MPFFYLADTWWYGMTSRVSLLDFERMAKKRKEQGFSAIQIVVGAPPEIDIFSVHARNSGGGAFNKDFSLNKKYFNEVDKKLAILKKYDLVACILGSWGPHIDILGEEPIKNLWKEIVTRYHALSVVWCVCGEFDLPLQATSHNRLILIASKLFRRFEFLRTILPRNISQKRLTRWSNIANYISSIDPSHNPITIHPHSPIRSSILFNNPTWLAIDSIQTGHTQNTKALLRSSSLDAYFEHKKFINLEPWYECEQFSAYDQRYGFWMSVLSGSAGYAYGAHGVWNMSVQDNFLGHWGNVHWKSSINYDGAIHIGRGKKLLTSLKKWWTLTPVTDLIDPQWNARDLDLPVTATTSDGLILIYVPDWKNSKTLSFKNKKLNNTKAIVHDPEAFTNTPVLIQNNELNFSGIRTKDVIITIKFDTITT